MTQSCYIILLYICASPEGGCVRAERWVEVCECLSGRYRSIDCRRCHQVSADLNLRKPPSLSATIAVAALQSGSPASAPHRISLRLTARLLRLPLKGRVILARLVQASRITPPLRGSRREGGARSRAGGGQTPRPMSEYRWCAGENHRLSPHPAGARSSTPLPSARAGRSRESRPRWHCHSLWPPGRSIPVGR